MNFFWSYQQALFEAIKYGYLYNWFATQDRYTANVEYGYLVNWYAVADSRNIANVGWHVPTNVEFDALITYLGGTSVAGGKLKETGTAYWQSPNTSATNEVGFNGRGSGYRLQGTGSFLAFKTDLICWTSIEYNATLAGYRQLNYATASTQSGYIEKTRGQSVRLIKDSTTLTHGQTGTYVGNDNRIYQTICIGTQEWLSENLLETKYRDGSSIPEVTDNSAWAALTTGARCSYSNTESNAGTTTNVGGITSSSDWVVPTMPQMTILREYLDTMGDPIPVLNNNAGRKMKESGLLYWDVDAGTNTSGFNARGSGWRNPFVTPQFEDLKRRINFWSITAGAVNSYYRGAIIHNGDFFQEQNGSVNVKVGMAIRLLYTGSGTPTSYIGNDGKVYRVITIGTQTWLADNLAETLYRNGDTIPVVTDNTTWAGLTTGARCVYDNDESNK